VCPVGGGGLFREDWFYTKWAVDHPQLTTVHINQKETFTVLVALTHWKHQLHDKWTVVRSDNYTTISALNKDHAATHGSCNGFAKYFGSQPHTTFESPQPTYPQEQTVADAIACLQDPCFCHMLSGLLGGPQEEKQAPWPHFSRAAFPSFPRQVQCMIKNSYFTKN